MKWAPFDRLFPDQREAWWLQLISEAAEAEATYRGDADDPLAILGRVQDRLEAAGYGEVDDDE